MMSPLISTRQPILLADDSDADRSLFQAALDAAGCEHPLQMVEDGQQAIAYLAGEGPYADRSRFPLPGLVILDVKMPLKNGFETLEWIRGREQFATLPILMMTSSDHPEEIEAAYRKGANAFLVKPPTFRELGEMVLAVEKFWLRFNRRP